MLEPQEWMVDVCHRLKDAFGSRLLYLGLQGSYRRGEADEASDIDLVVLMDTVGLDDLDIYRRIVRLMPEGHKACGFISGVREFIHWPRHELFAFKKDTSDYYGKLDDYLPSITREDVVNGAKIGASILVHLLTHSYLYAEAETRPTILKDAYKSAFFVMQVTNYLETGVYCRSKKELLTCSCGVERDIIIAGLDFPAWLVDHSEKETFQQLLEWCNNTIISY